MTTTVTTTARELRLVACDLVKVRFAGRAELRREAATDEEALLRLEAALGLITPEQHDELLGELKLVRAMAKANELARAVAKGRRGDEPDAAVVRRWYKLITGDGMGFERALLVPQWWVTEVRAKRAARAARKPEPFASTAERLAVRRVERAMRAARFRTARHCHSLEVRLCRVGETPWATSISGRTDPRTAGLPNAYARKAYSVATSDHEVRVDRRALEAVRASGRGVVYLTESLRVVQSRGTSLAIEQQVEGVRGLRWVRWAR